MTDGKGEIMNKERLFQMPPVFPEKNRHPRILLKPEDIPRIKSGFGNEENIKMYEEALRLSELEHSGVLPPLSPGSLTNENDEAVGCAEAAAFFYAVDGDEAKGKKAIRIMLNYLETLMIDGAGDPVTRQTGHAIYVASCVYDWCYPLLTEKNKSDFKKLMLENAGKMELGWPPVREHFIVGHGVEYQTFRDDLAMGIALYDEAPEIYNLIAGRIFEKMIEARDYVNGSDMFSEGSNYGPFRLPMELFGTLLLSDIASENVFSVHQLYTLYGGAIYNRLPNGRFIETGDASKFSDGYINDPADACFIAGNYYKDPQIRKMYYKCNPSAVNFALGRYGISAVIHLILNRHEVGVAGWSKLPETAYFGEPLGTIIARTGWSEGSDSEDIVVKMNAGQHSFMNHQHSDSGHFDIYYKGLLAVDSGIYSSAPFMEDGAPVKRLCYGSKHDSNYNKRTIAHNCMLVYDPEETGWFESDVNDGGQTRYDIPYTMEEAADEKFFQGHPTAYDFGPDEIKPEYSYLKGDLKGAYTKKVADYQRTFVFLRATDKNNPASLIVFDNITSVDSSFKKTWLMHTMPEPEICEKGFRVERNGGRLTCRTLLPEACRVSKIGGAGKEFTVNGVNQTAVPRSSRHETGKWRIEITPEAASEKDYFLNVMVIDDSGAVTENDNIRIIEDNEAYIGILTGTRAVFIRKNNDKAAKDTSFDIPENVDTVIITGLNAGEWTAEMSGSIISKKDITLMNDSMYLNTGSGSLLLKYKPAACPEKSDKKHFSEFLDNDLSKEPIDIKIDARFETFSNLPFSQNGILYVPAAEYFRKLKYSYTDENGIVTVKAGDVKCVFSPNSSTATVEENGVVTDVTLEGESIVKNGALYIPIINISGYINTHAEWYDYSKCAFVSKIGIESEANCIRALTSTDDTRVVISGGRWSENQAFGSKPDSGEGSSDAYWTAYGDEQWLEFEFEAVRTVSSIEIYFVDGEKAKTKFDILLSPDGTVWNKVFSGESDGKTKGFEKFLMPAESRGKYMKLIGHGNNIDKWTKINEIILYNQEGQV